MNIITSERKTFGCQSARAMTLSLGSQEEMEYFAFDDIGSMIPNEAIKRLILPMTVQLCHLIMSMERNDTESETFASLEKTAEELAQASEKFVQIAKR